MMIFGSLLLGIGFLGLSWVLVGSALVSILYYFLSNPRNAIINKIEKKIYFEILLAAYNEDKVIEASLESYEKSFKSLNSINKNIELSLIVGLDHCTDKTLELVENFKKSSQLKTKIYENQNQKGKWFVIKELILRSNADWVSLSDCGSIWNENILKEVSHHLSNKELVCIAPSYLPSKSGFLETIYWRLEQFLRRIENLAGGSIMVHGPTVFYRRSALLRAISILGDRHWINDDVAIPLALRMQNEQKKILYFSTLSPVAWVRDLGVTSNLIVEKNRRRRIFIGNVQIIKEIIIPMFSFYNISSWLSLRLIFKVLWAYWVTFIFSGFLICTLSSSFLVKNFLAQSILYINLEVFLFFLFSMIIFKSNYIQRIFMAYIAGIMFWKGISVLRNPKSFLWS